jgi:hypothetical protein
MTCCWNCRYCDASLQLRFYIQNVSSPTQNIDIKPTLLWCGQVRQITNQGIGLGPLIRYIFINYWSKIQLIYKINRHGQSLALLALDLQYISKSRSKVHDQTYEGSYIRWNHLSNIWNKLTHRPFYNSWVCTSWQIFAAISKTCNLSSKWLTWLKNRLTKVINSLTAMDVNLRVENPSVDRQGRRSTFHLIQPKITRCLPCTLPIDGKTLQNESGESPDVCRRWMLIVILRILFTSLLST